MYNIGEVSEMTGLPVSTLRYYDKQGLFPDLQRTSGIRKFSDKEIEVLRVVECLKKSGLSISDIRLFIDWCAQGADTFEQRKQLLERQRKKVEAEIRHLNKVLDMLNFKCWFYEQALLDGDDKRVRSLLPDKLPSEIRKCYDNAHSDEI